MFYILEIEGTFRSAWSFMKMVRATTKRRAYDFVGYGNWCGFGGKGTLLDRIDR